MDAATLTAFLVPFLPFLMKIGDKVTETAVAKFGEDAWNRAKLIWAKLSPVVAAKADAQDAATRVVAKPDSEARQSVLQEELAALLAENRDLAAAIAQIMQNASDGTPRPQVMQNVTGNQNQIIGQAHGSQVFGNMIGNVSFGASSPTSSVSAAATAHTTPAKTILILAANPKGTSSLRLDEEVREIQHGLERASQRDRFVLQQRWAVSPKEVQRVLLNCKPNIVHFCGHGIGTPAPASELPIRKASFVSAGHHEEGLMFENATGQPQLVPSQALSSLFSLFAHQVECVVLNACYSEVQAAAIAQHISYVIGMNRAIGDRAAIEFAIGFYDALLAGESVEFAYRLGCSAIQMAGIPEHLTPVLKRKTAT